MKLRDRAAWCTTLLIFAGVVWFTCEIVMGLAVENSGTAHLATSCPKAKFAAITGSVHAFVDQMSKYQNLAIPRTDTTNGGLVHLFIRVRRIKDRLTRRDDGFRCTTGIDIVPFYLPLRV